MTCKACMERGKTWAGDDPRCAFPNGGRFTSDNWMCATMDTVRDYCEEQLYEDPADICDKIVRVEDQTAIFIPVEDEELSLENIAMAWYVSWYKRRGNTEALLLLTDAGAELPTEQQVLRWFSTQ